MAQTAKSRRAGKSLAGQLLTTREVAAFLQLSEWTLKSWRRGKRHETGPTFVKLGSRNCTVRYRLGDLLDWLARRRRGRK
jgi:predicted DNA-binding transcriptional regulator AlpA